MPSARKKPAAPKTPAPKAGVFVISDRSKAEMKSGAGTKSDFDKPRLDLFPSPEFMAGALAMCPPGPVKDMLFFVNAFWGGMGNPTTLIEAGRFCQQAMGLDDASGFFPSAGFMQITGEISTLGALKYSDRNWENGMRWGRMYAAFLRHTFAHLGGETNDPETGKPHLGHAGWNIVALYTHAVRRLGEDNRAQCHKPPRQTKRQGA